jgi:hypothetical protein
MSKNFYEKYLTSRLAQEKYADFVLKNAENLFGIVFTSLLSIGAIHFYFPSTAALIPVWVVGTLAAFAILAGICLLSYSLSRYQLIGDEPVTRSSEVCIGAPQDNQSVCKEISISSSGNVNISIDCSTSKISIRIDGPSKENA